MEYYTHITSHTTMITRSRSRERSHSRETGSISPPGQSSHTVVPPSDPSPTGSPDHLHREGPPSPRVHSLFSPPRLQSLPMLETTHEEIAGDISTRDNVTTRVENLTSLAQARYIVSIFEKTNLLFLYTFRVQHVSRYDMSDLCVDSNLNLDGECPSHHLTPELTLLLLLLLLLLLFPLSFLARYPKGSK